jgi:hypothetical protein
MDVGYTLIKQGVLIIMENKKEDDHKSRLLINVIEQYALTSPGRRWP